MFEACAEAGAVGGGVILRGEPLHGQLGGSCDVYLQAPGDELDSRRRIYAEVTGSATRAG